MRTARADRWSLWSPWWCAALCAAALSGCSLSKLVQRDPAFPKFPKAPEASVVSVPGTADFGDTRELKHPDRVQLAYGRWQEQQRQPALAREAYQKALDHDPKSLEALLGLSRLDALAGRTSAAAEHLDKAQKLHPSDPLVYAGWGEFYAAQENWQHAIVRYRQAVDLAPDEATYKHQLAVALVKTGSLNEGLSMFSAIVGPPEAHYNVAVLLHREGRTVEAEQHLQKALALNPELEPASMLLSRLHRERGRAPAVAAVPSAVAVSPPVQPAVTPPTTPASPVAASPVTSAGWTAAGPSHVQRASYAPTPQQLEQWRNQQAPPR